LILLNTDPLEEPNCRKVVISNVCPDHPNGGVLDPTECLHRECPTEPFAAMCSVNLQVLDLGSGIGAGSPRCPTPRRLVTGNKK
jgi:hypothetical protein